MDTQVTTSPALSLPAGPGPIGIFDSGYGGLTILRQMRGTMPQYDYLYLGDNARAPYGTRSFDVVYEFTRQAVLRMFQMGCQLVVLGCNTASAKALRSLQQNDLPQWDPSRRVLGVIRPTVESLASLTHSGHVGLCATPGTIRSRTYEMEIQKLYGDSITLTGESCPMWVPLIENNEFDSPGADYFVEKRIGNLLRHDPQIDTIILGCTHYPLLYDKIMKYTPRSVRLVSQGEYVADSLREYLSRHADMHARISQHSTCRFYTTENPENFEQTAAIFLRQPVTAERIMLG